MSQRISVLYNLINSPIVYKLIQKVMSGTSFRKNIITRNIKRNILDIDDAIKNCIKLIKLKNTKNDVVNLLNYQFYTPFQIVKTFEKILNKKAYFKIKKIDKKNWFLKNNFKIKTKNIYLFKTLKKYYS